MKWNILLITWVSIEKLEKLEIKYFTTLIDSNKLYSRNQITSPLLGPIISIIIVLNRFTVKMNSTRLFIRRFILYLSNFNENNKADTTGIYFNFVMLHFFTYSVWTIIMKFTGLSENFARRFVATRSNDLSLWYIEFQWFWI